MNRYARTAKADKPEIVQVARPFSNFDFIEERFGELPSLRRLMSQVRQHKARAMVIEEVTAAEELREENEDIAHLYPSFNPEFSSHSWRLSFFKKAFKRRGQISGATNEDLLGYAIIKDDDVPNRGRIPRIYESVTRTSRHGNNFVHGAPKSHCRVAGCRFEVQGYPYAQQNAITNSCAHVAIRTVAARFGADISFREMNRIARAKGRERRLNSDQVKAILKAIGAGFYMLDLEKEPSDALFHKYIYGSIESGYPAIVVLRPAKGKELHAIPVFGHTFNEDTWVPRAEISYFEVGERTKYISSEAWLSMYVAHDDNLGSNYCIPRGYLRVTPRCDYLQGRPLCPAEFQRYCHVVATFPAEIKMNAVRAEVIGADYLFTILPQMPEYAAKWGNQMQRFAADKMLVLRPVLIDLHQYATHLSRVRGWAGERIDRQLVKRIHSAPNPNLWMVELSVPELFSANRRKVGEVLLYAGVRPGSVRDFRNFAFARLPGCFAFYMGGPPERPKYNFHPSGIASHIELWRCEENRSPESNT